MSETMDLMGWFEDASRPRVLKRPWMDDKHMELVTTVDRLREVVDECIASGRYAKDLETTGLDNRVFPGPQHGTTFDKIAGYCLSPDGVRGYYVPVRHRTDKGELLPCNVPIREAAAEIRRLAESPAKAVFHHAKFDTEFLEWGEDEPMGTWDDYQHWDDTHILAYLRNPRERNKGLKHLAMQELQLDMIELEELFTDEQKKALGGRLDFSLLDPTWGPCIWYACSDAICTRLLFDVLHPAVMNPEPHGQSQATIYRLEKMCVPATRWMERCRIFIDRTKVEELIQLGQQEWFDSLDEVYDEASKMLGRNVRPGWYRLMRGIEPTEVNPQEYKFDPQAMQPTYMESRDEADKRATQSRLDPMVVGSSGKNRVQTLSKEVSSLLNPKKHEMVEFPVVYDVTIASELGSLMRELGVSGLTTTEKSGQIKTSKDELDRVIEEAGEQFPFMRKVKRFRETAKALGTNLFPIWYDTSKERSPDGTVRVNFNAHKVDTGRFSTPQPRENVFHGQVRWNLHSIPATYDKNKPACMLRIREVVAARPGHILFAIDYSGVELRIVTNLSREHLWVTEFFRCSTCNTTFDRGNGKETPPCPPPFCPKCGSDKIGDLHTLTALSIYGAEAANSPEFKQMRQSSKALNFAMCYGGGGSAAQRAVGVDKDEGWRIKRKFDATYKGLQAWWTTQHNFAAKYKYVITSFGRRYPLPDIDHEMKGFQEKAKRNAVNGPVQGTSADIMKLAMALIYNECKKRGWLELVRMAITIHDELVFEIADSIAEEAIEVIVPIMTINTVKNLKAPIPLKVDIEFGVNWLVAYHLTEMTWNKAKPGKWSLKWTKVFPKAYAHYLKCGGTPVEGALPPVPPASDGGSNVGEAPMEVPPEPTVNTEVSTAGVPTPPPPSPPIQSKGLFEMPDTGKGKPYIHVIPTAKLTNEMTDALARLILKCDGSGTQVLVLRTELGAVLWEGRTHVSAAKFKILAEEAGF